MQAQQPEKSEEASKKTSVYELPSLPVEFPPKDDGDGSTGDQPRRSVTFEVQLKVSNIT